jgi:hypothetical protein
MLDQKPLRSHGGRAFQKHHACFVPEAVQQQRHVVQRRARLDEREQRIHVRQHLAQRMVLMDIV